MREPFSIRVRACLSKLFFDGKCAVETKYSDLIGRDFNYRSLFRRWLRSRPIRSGFLFSTSFDLTFSIEKDVLRHTLNTGRCRRNPRSKGDLKTGFSQNEGRPVFSLREKRLLYRSNPKPATRFRNAPGPGVVVSSKGHGTLRTRRNKAAHHLHT